MRKVYYVHALIIVCINRTVCILQLCFTGSVLTIDDLKRETELTDNQLDANVEKADLPELAAYFDNTDDYIEKLGLSSGQHTDVRTQAFVHGTRAGMKLALKYWMEKNPYEASYRALLLMLVSLEKGDIAVNVCKYLSKKGEVINFVILFVDF